MRQADGCRQRCCPPSSTNRGCRAGLPVKGGRSAARGSWLAGGACGGQQRQQPCPAPAQPHDRLTGAHSAQPSGTAASTKPAPKLGQRRTLPLRITVSPTVRPDVSSYTCAAGQPQSLAISQLLLGRARCIVLACVGAGSQAWRLPLPLLRAAALPSCFSGGTTAMLHPQQSRLLGWQSCDSKTDCTGADTPAGQLPRCRLAAHPTWMVAVSASSRMF